MPWNFKAVYFEAVGYCNAKCAYCHSGVSRPARAKFLDVDVFRQSLTRLLAEEVVQKRQVISLYNWGEPVLHPRLGELAGVVNDLGLKYAFSTNASRVPKIDRAFVQSLDHVIFSMPGFSQEAYDRIHGFRFPEILANIDRIVNACREHGFKGRFAISYHVYKFNLGEMRPCEQFADERDIHFNPYYAILNNWWEINDYVTGRLPEEKRQVAKRDLFTLDEIERVMAEAPKSGYRCPQNDFLNIDESGTIVTCCQIGKGDPGYGNGHAVTDDLQAAIQKKMTNAVCNGCIGSGLAYYLNTALQRPAFYKPSLRQRLIRARSVYRRAVDEGFWPVAVKAIKRRVAARKITATPAPSPA
jgi:MoaA/NifB/PqqE/SkfB family radical SAM enzyme